MKIVFISGPFRHPNPDGSNDSWETHLNVVVASRLGLEVAKAGAFPFIPHANTAHFDHAAGIPDQLWLDGDLELLGRCDAMLCTYDWKRSAGARGEVEYATKHNIPIFYDIGELRRWLVGND